MPYQQLNSTIKEGLLKVNSDYSVQWQGDVAAKESLKGGSCKTHWWGEECAVNSSTTKKSARTLREERERFCYAA